MNEKSYTSRSRTFTSSQSASRSLSGRIPSHRYHTPEYSTGSMEGEERVERICQKFTKRGKRDITKRDL